MQGNTFRTDNQPKNKALTTVGSDTHITGAEEAAPHGGEIININIGNEVKTVSNTNDDSSQIGFGVKLRKDFRNVTNTSGMSKNSNTRYQNMEILRQM